MKNTKRSLTTSVIILFLCFSMLLGTTYAWFTDSASSAGNIIQSGNLDIKMHWSENFVDWSEVTGDPIFTYDNWEPGYTEIRYIKVENAGNLSFKWKLNIEAEGRVGELAEVIDVYYINPAENLITTLANLQSVGVLSDVIANKTATEGVLLPVGTTPEQGTPDNYLVGETTLAIAFHMQESAGNKYQNQSVGDGFTVSLVATQVSYESDAFGNTYDQNAEWPTVNVRRGITARTAVNVTSDNKVANEATMTTDGASATIPAGVKLEDGVSELVLNITPKNDSEANVVLNDDEKMASIDIHIDGVAEDNEVVMAIKRDALLPRGLNMGNYRFYHVEDGATVEMTLRENGATPEHNDYDYDPATGDVVLYLKSFSEVALIADNNPSWQGKRNYDWYNTTDTILYIANADQFAGLSAIVGGMDGQIQDSFSGKTVKLLADLDFGYDPNAIDGSSYSIFYPVGYYNNEGTYERKPVEERETAVESGFYRFMGTFDGNGNTIANIYQNTWEMKGDHNWYNAITEQYYRDGMGLFGKVYGGTVKNLTVRNFSSDGEITTTGVIAAYADGATFENIAIFNCNPRVYNIGNGGIVGCVGWYATDENLKTTFKNITVDNTNKISALWGSWDVACGGIVGQYYPTSGQSSANYPKNAGISLENCHVAAQIDVYNDVCANYQYYAYRYAGMLIGSVRENEEVDGHSYPKMDGITAKDCTVHFGTWNDYYYCEIIDNTTASYTHDYQMSRLTEIKAIDGTTITYLDGTTGKVPTSGRANYVIVDYSKGHDTQNANCYHFKDGEVWNHADGGYHDGTDGGKIIDENGDGAPDLREDKEHIYLEFNNLVTGYGWGVTSKGIDDFDGVTILDREVADSVVKFEEIKHLDGFGYKVGDVIRIGNLFKAVEGANINTATVYVAISPEIVGHYIINATYTPSNTGNWEDGTITFHEDCKGNARIVITDYFYCTETEIVLYPGDMSIGPLTPGIEDAEDDLTKN